MTLFADSQQKASNPSAFQAGVPTQNLLDGYTSAAQAATDLLVASGCYYGDVNGVDTTVQQTTASVGANLFAGVVLRTNSNAMPFSQSLQGFSATIPAGFSNAEFLTRGSVPVYITLANEAGNVPSLGSAVYCMLDGTFQTQKVAGVAPVGGTLTNFRVRQVPAGWTAGAIVVITNTQNVGA